MLRILDASPRVPAPAAPVHSAPDSVSVFREQSSSSLSHTIQESILLKLGRFPS